MPEFAVLILDTPDCAEIQTLLQTDPPAAITRLRAHAQQGEPQSQLALGQLLVNGVGTPRDETQALRWFHKAATSRVPMAMNMVGRCHEYGLGTCVDYEQAAQWYYRASLFECDWAVYNYATCWPTAVESKKTALPPSPGSSSPPPAATRAPCTFSAYITRTVGKPRQTGISPSLGIAGRQTEATIAANAVTRPSLPSTAEWRKRCTGCAWPQRPQHLPISMRWLQH